MVERDAFRGCKWAMWFGGTYVHLGLEVMRYDFDTWREALQGYPPPTCLACNSLLPVLLAALQHTSLSPSQDLYTRSSFSFRAEFPSSSPSWLLLGSCFPAQPSVQIPGRLLSFLSVPPHLQPGQAGTFHIRVKLCLLSWFFFPYFL